MAETRTDAELLILIYRTYKFTQEVTAYYLGCRKEKVVKTDKWFKTCPIEEAQAFVEGDAVQRLIEREVSQMEPYKGSNKKPPNLNGNEVLLRFGRSRIKEGTADPAVMGIYYRHWGKVLGEARDLQKDLSGPWPELIFNPYFCQRVILAVREKRPLIKDNSNWTNVTEGGTTPGIWMRLKSQGEDSGVQINTMAEIPGSPQVRCLLNHLVFEPGWQFSFDAWKQDYARLLEQCIALIELVGASFCKTVGYDYTEFDPGVNGLFYAAPAHICRFVVENAGKDNNMLLTRQEDKNGLMKLFETGFTKTILALDEVDRLECYQRAIESEVKSHISRDQCRTMHYEFERLSHDGWSLNGMVDNLKTRGNLNGVCQECVGYPGVLGHTS